jgi:cytochrome P450
VTVIDRAATRPSGDLTSAATFDGGQPHDLFAWLRANEPVSWHREPAGPGFWAVTRHAEVCAVGKDHRRFSSEPTIMIEDPDPAGRPDLADHKMMLMSDPPYHTVLRRIISRDFTPRSAEAYRARCGELARQIVDEVVERGECDLVHDIAGEMPSFVAAELLGLPLADGRELYRLTEVLHSDPASLPPGAGAAAMGEMFAYAQGVVAEKRARPADDLSSKLLAAEVDGHRLDDIDFGLFFLLLIDAAGDTTRNLFAGGYRALFDHPEQRARLQADPDLLPTAIEELLRWVSPVIYMRRTATGDTELAGQPIAAGDKVVMYYGSANRDEAVFDRADQLDLGRRPNPHVAFGGGGPHFCLGSHLARVELQELFREVLTRLPDVEPAGEAEWLPSIFISGPRTMPVRFTPGRRSDR